MDFRRAAGSCEYEDRIFYIIISASECHQITSHSLGHRSVCTAFQLHIIMHPLSSQIHNIHRNTLSASTSSSNMCRSKEFTAHNIVAKVWAIPRAKHYISHLAFSSPSAAPQIIPAPPPLFTKASCCNGAGPPNTGNNNEKKNSLNFVLNEDNSNSSEEQQKHQDELNCLVQIAVLDGTKVAECIFTCFTGCRYAKLKIDVQRFLLFAHDPVASDSRNRSILKSTFGPLLSPDLPLLHPPPPPNSNSSDKSNSIPTPTTQRIAPGPSTPSKPLTNEERKDAARKEKEEMRKIRKREAAARSNKRRSEAKRKKVQKVINEK